MRLKFLAASFAILFAHTMAAAAPKPPALMTPTGPWNVELTDKMCLLSRPYGEDRSTHLIFKPAMLGDGLEIIVTRATSAIDHPADGKTALAVAGSPLSAESSFSAYSTGKLRFLRVWIKEGAISLPSITGTLQIDANPEGRHLFAISGIERALPVLSICLEKLRTAFKVSKTDLAAVVTKPEVNTVDDFSLNDLPPGIVMSGQSGTVGVLLWVEATGRVSTCEVIESSAGSFLEKRTCKILTKRARYTPARDAEGRTIRAPAFSRIRWQLPAL